MMIHDVTSQAGARKRRKRVGRGESSGMGRTSGRGNKGQQARSGYSGRVLTEGGGMPIFRRMPKRGFNNFNFRTEYDVVNVAELEEVFDNGAQVTAATLSDARLIRNPDAMVKILGDGELTKKLSLQVHAVSQKARELIEKAGGSVSLIERRNPAAAAKAKRNVAKKRGKREASPSRLEKKRNSRQA
jgi:large subunit ribosomal protein L15